MAVALTMTSPPIQHSVALSWKASANTNVISYSMYRSTLAGTSYGLTASAIGGLAYSDQSVQPGTTYYYVVTAWTAKVERVAIRMRSAWWFPND